MKCQDCKKKDAQVHLTQIVNNEKTTLHLCKDCAAARGFHSPFENKPFPLAEILSGLASKGPTSAGGSMTLPDLTCPQCGLTFEAFTHQGRFGCGHCYQAFRPQLEKIMREVHGASLHRGRSPVYPSDRTTEVDHPLPVKEEERLEAELQKAIDGEQFERAAEIRDKLKTLRAGEPEVVSAEED